MQIPGQVIFAGLGFYPNGQLLGAGVVKACQGIDPCEVLWLPGLPTLPLEVARAGGPLRGHQATLEHQNCRDCGRRVSRRTGSYGHLERLRAHPNLNVVVSSGDQMIAGAYKAEQLAGKAGDIANVGNGCTVEAKQLILADKELACSVYLPITEGRLVVQALVNAVKGSTKTGIYVNPKSPIGRLGTKANIAKFTPQFHS